MVEILELIVLQFGHGLRQNLLIGLIAQVLHEAALLSAEQVAGAADVKILHGKVETTAEVGERLQCLQASARLGCEHAAGRREQVAERLAVAAPHPTAHLMKVGQTEVLRIVDDDGIGIGDVDTVLHNGRREQHVVVIVDEAHDDFLKLLWGHLTVADGYTTIGYILPDELRDMRQTRDAVVDKEHLTATAHLEVDGVSDDLVAERAQLGVDGIAVGRRRAHDAHVAGSHQRELQGAGDGRGRHRERVDIGLELAQFLLGGHAELLLLVDDEQAEVVPLHGLTDELVGANKNVDTPARKVVQHLPRLLGRPGSREIVNRNGEIGKALAEGLEMLISQHRRRHKHRRLLAVAGCLERSPHGHLGLAEAHVAADETVHRDGALHVSLHVLRGLELVGGILVEETGL